jgi:hypothetical protein
MNGGMYIALYCLSFFTMILLWRVWPKKWPLWTIFPVALIVRVAFLPFPANSDINRYMWEGKIQNAGFNPYALAPDAPVLSPLRDRTWERVNHKNFPAIYGPASELLFKACASQTPSPLLFKIIFIAFDLGAMVFITLLMRSWSMEPRHLLLYALNPVILFAIAGEGHLESVMLFWLAGAFYFFRTRHHTATFLFFGLALATKLTPVFLFPFLLTKKNARFSFWTLVPIGLYGLYIGPGVSFLSVPLRFAAEFHFNGFFSTIFSWMAPAAALPLICLFLFALAILYLFFFTPNRMAAAFLASGAFVLCSTTAHPWYLTLVTIWLPFFRSRPWIALHGAIGLAALVNFHYIATGVWQEQPLLWAAQYVPFAALALGDLARGASYSPLTYGRPSFLSIIIPTLNERTNILSCIRSIVTSPLIGHEIIVVDGGSIDGTREAAAQFPAVRFMESAPGRGIQIKKGVSAAMGDVIWVLHADSHADALSITRLANALENNPHAAGGAFRSRYSSSRKRYGLTAMLNNYRAFLTGVSFGDQAQFFRVAAVGDRFPAFKIMEDVELSFLIKERGGALLLPCSVENSVRKWERDGYMRNFFMVTWLTLRYIVQRRFNLVSMDREEFYTLYYQGKRTKKWEPSKPSVAQS